MKIKASFLIGLLSVCCYSSQSPELAPEVKLDQIKNKTSQTFHELENSLSPLNQTFIDASPKDRQDGIPVGELQGKSTGLIKIAEDLAVTNPDRIDSLLVAHRDKLVFESYYLLGRVNLPHAQASATKSYTALAIGRAIQLGYLSMEDLDKPMVNFFKGMASEKSVDGTQSITLAHLMSMRSGIRISREKMKSMMADTDPLKGAGLVSAYLANSQPINSRTQRYHYQAPDARIAMLVLDQMVPGSANTFIKNQLLEPLGVRVYEWKQNISGVFEAAYGSRMTSRDMLKWGSLIKNKGQWNGEQLIPKAFIAKATSKISQPSDPGYDFSNFGYGFFIWQTEFSHAGKSYTANLCWGGGGQYIIVVEDLDLVVVVTGRAKGIDDASLAMVAEQIIPLFK